MKSKFSSFLLVYVLLLLSLSGCSKKPAQPDLSTLNAAQKLVLLDSGAQTVAISDPRVVQIQAELSGAVAVWGGTEQAIADQIEKAAGLAKAEGMPISRMDLAQAVDALKSLGLPCDQVLGNYLVFRKSGMPHEQVIATMSTMYTGHHAESVKEP